MRKKSAEKGSQKAGNFVIKKSLLWKDNLSSYYLLIVVHFLYPSFHIVLFVQFYNVESAKGLSWGPIMAKFPSLRSVGRKGLVAVIEYQSLVAATNNFQEQNALGEGRLGCVYKAQFNNDIQAAVKKFRGGEQDAEKEFEVVW